MFGNEVLGSAVLGMSEVSDSTAIGFYAGYAVLAIGLVVWLARTLKTNGEVFLSDVFEQSDMAKAVNHLLVVGFYLLNLGYALLLYKLDTSYPSLITAFNDLVGKVGLLVLSLGVIHMVNMFIFWKIRNYKYKAVTRTPPPAAFLPPPPAPTSV